MALCTAENNLTGRQVRNLEAPVYFFTLKTALFKLVQKHYTKESCSYEGNQFCHGIKFQLSIKWPQQEYETEEMLESCLVTLKKGCVN